MSVDEHQMLTCDCGCKYFEKRELSMIQIKNKFLPFEVLVPCDQHKLAKCQYCGTLYDKEGNKVTMEDVMKW